MEEIKNVMPHRRTWAEIQAARDAAGLEAIQPKIYKCTKCHDTGWITVRREGLQPESVPCECYARRQFERSLKNSGISPELLERCTLEKFLTPDENASRMKETALAFLADKSARGLGYFGRSGSGKTHICTGVCIKMAESGKSVKYMQYNSAMRKAIASKYSADRQESILTPFIDCEVLYIDDLFKNAVDARTAHLATDEKRIMLDLLDTRYKNNAITIISTEMALIEIVKEDEALGSRIREMLGKHGCKCSGANRRISGI